MFVYTIQPVVKPDVQPVSQPVVSCKRGIRDRVVAAQGQGTIEDPDGGISNEDLLFQCRPTREIKFCS